MKFQRSNTPWWVITAATALLGTAGGLQLRSYSAPRHDRFTGFPASPQWNDGAWFGSRNYTGVGWRVGDPEMQRQFALVSPLHVVFATHYQPGVGSVIRFLNSAGATVDRTVTLQTPIRNDLNQDTDLTLLTLSAPLLAADQVTHFPYLNLTNEAAYVNAALVVFGWQAKAGGGRIAAFDDMEGDGINRTRMLRFDYNKRFGQPDDARVEIGDSGSPSFAVIDGRPAVVGIHSSLEENINKYLCYDTFVPHYVEQLNTLMAPTGYQMTPANPLPVTVAVTAVPSPVPWRQAMAASCRIELANTSANIVSNPSLRMQFPPDRPPSTLTAPDWIITPGAAGEWLLRRAALAAGATSSLTAAWEDVGTADTLAIRLDLRADGLTEQSHDLTQQLAPSYQAWAAGLADPSPVADGDADGLPNLLEYAFGGDPAVASAFQPTGAALRPAMQVADGTADLAFPVRADAELRGLSYLVEFSPTLAAESWSSTPPPGYAVADHPLVPAAPGFLSRTVTFDATAPRQFCRVRVVLHEAP
jgi:hypothetical protein